MDLVPVAISLIFIYLTQNVFIIDSWSSLAIGVLLYGIIYIPLFVVLGMNKYERNLFRPICKRIFR